MSLAGEKRRPPYRSASIAHELITFPGHNAHLTAPANCIIRALLADAASVCKLSLTSMHCTVMEDAQCWQCCMQVVCHGAG